MFIKLQHKIILTGYFNLRKEASHQAIDTFCKQLS